MADGEVTGDVRELRQMLADCERYLKEGETPAQRIERERRDTEAVLNLLIREKHKTERMIEALRQIAAMDPQRVRADDLGRAARIARGALADGVEGTPK